MDIWNILKNSSFKFFKDSLEPFVKFFESIKPDLYRANIGLTLEEYVYIMVFSIFLVFIIEFPLITVILSILFNDILTSFFLSITFNIVIILVMFFVFYTYPSMICKKRRKNIEAGLPFAATYMSTMATSGAPPPAMFKVLSEFEEYGEISKESGKIYRDIEAFGMDLVGAMRKTANRTPSEEFKELLWGLDTVLSSGSNVGDFLHEKSRFFIAEYRRRLQKYSKTLSILIEIYLTLVLVGSIFFLIVTALMSILGGGGMGLQIPFLQFLIVFLVLPLVSIGFIFLVKSIAPAT